MTIQRMKWLISLIGMILIAVGAIYFNLSLTEGLLLIVVVGILEFLAKHLYRKYQFRKNKSIGTTE
jgi:uncharacterized membrane protein YGL010W